MGLDFFRDVVAFQKKYTHPGQIVENSIQTNGLLLDNQWCEFLRKENFLVGISLDGPAPIHDFCGISAMMDNLLRFRFASLKAELPEACEECRIVPFCRGDCIRFRYLPEKGYKNISEYCTAIKRVYNHIEPHLPEIRKRVAPYRSQEQWA